MKDWKVGKGSRACAATGRAFEPGEVYYSALLEEGEGFRRLDYAADAWAEVNTGTLFSFWKTRMPTEDEGQSSRPRTVDTEVIHAVFRRLADAEGPEKQTFRYLLALMLVRKRRLRLDDIRRDGDVEVLEVWDRTASETATVVNPEASAEALDAAQRELAVIFDMDFDEDDASGASNVEEPAEAGQSAAEAEAESAPPQEEPAPAVHAKQ
jgi:hypothetical protein